MLVFDCVRNVLNQADVTRLVHRKALVLAAHFEPEHGAVITLVREHERHFGVLVDIVKVKLETSPVLRRKNVSEQAVLAQIIKERVRHELRKRTDKFKLVREHNDELTEVAREKRIKLLPFPVVEQQQNGDNQKKQEHGADIAPAHRPVYRVRHTLIR